MNKIELKKYKAIIFDLFHTLTSLESIRGFGKGTSEVLGVPRDEWNKQLLFYSEDRLRGKIKDPFEIIKMMAHAIDPNISEKTIREAANNRNSRFKFSLRNIKPETLSTLKKLKTLGKLLGLVSNGDVNEIAGWNDSPVKPYFDSVVFSCNVGYIKPEKEIYEICLNELNVTPKECLFVGDGGSDELKGAKELGFTTVITIHVIKQIWPGKIAGRKMYADHEIDEITELLEL